MTPPLDAAIAFPGMCSIEIFARESEFRSSDVHCTLVKISKKPKTFREGEWLKKFNYLHSLKTALAVKEKKKKA